MPSHLPSSTIRNVRFSLLAVTVSLTLTGCSSSGATESTPATSQAPPTVSDVDRQFLADVRGGMLLGDYLDDELVALGHGFCDNRLAGADPFADGRGADGQYEFTDPDVTVWAVDVLSIDYSARAFICPGV